ncbi:MAG: leucyl aminopeptidase, partial [Patescibacteria group bacterium]
FENKGLAKHPLLKNFPKEDLVYLEKVLPRVDLAGSQSRLVHLPSNPNLSVLFVGLGKESAWQVRSVAITARKIVTLAKENRIDSLAMALSDLSVKGLTKDKLLGSIAENLIMADYTFNDFKTKPDEGWPEVKTVTIYEPKVDNKLRQVLKETLIIADAVNKCRMLSDTPGAIMTPTFLAKTASKIRTNTPGIKVKVLEKAALKKLGMGGVIGVSQGSAEKPKFIILEYGPTNKKPLVFAGKGVTFDTGGINLKPESSSYNMHMDMSGGAAVIHAIEAIAKLKLSVHVVGLIPAVENMPSGSSYRPGDLLRTYTGKTIEVLNTDAEGRIILADALGYAQDYKPQLIVDIATLTGSAMGALGQRMTALFSNQEKLLNLGKKVGDQSGDYVWPMPLWDEYDEEIKGTFADVANIGKTRYGGAITAAAFLKQFVGDYPWMHLDIAPTMTSIEGQYLTKGAIGSGVRFLVELARQYK